MAGLAVSGIARDGGNELTLGETTSADDGGYELSYRTPPTGSGLVVRAVEATGHVLGESAPRFAFGRRRGRRLRRVAATARPTPCGWLTLI